MLKEVPSEVFRMACVMSTYRSKMEYSDELIETAKNNLKIFQNFMESCKAFQNGLLKSSVNKDVLLKKLEQSYEEIHNALCDDFNTPRVIKLLNELISTTNSMFYSTSQNSEMCNDISSVISVQKLVQDIIEIFGIRFNSKNEQSENFNNVMDILNEFRQNVRIIGISSKNTELLKMCDNVRDSLKQNGIEVKDYRSISSWSKNL